MSHEFDVFANGLAEDLDQALRTGTFDASHKEQEADPDSQRVKSRLMITFIRSSLPFLGMEQLKEKQTDIRLVAIYFSDRFEKWQKESKGKGGPDGEIIQGITLKELADCARNQFEAFCTEAGQVEIGSLRHKEMLERADYWGWTEQVVREVADWRIK